MGFQDAPKRGKGSHRAFYKQTESRKLLVIIPKRKIIPVGTLMSIIKQMGISKNEFLKIVKEM